MNISEFCIEEKTTRFIVLSARRFMDLRLMKKWL